MQKTPAGLVLHSATDLCHFLECQFLTARDLRALEEPLERVADTEDAELIQRKGHAHEAAYLAQLKAAGLQVVEIAHDRPAVMAARTREAMAAGADVIFQATFLDQGFLIDGVRLPVVGHADFLRRVEQPSALGGYRYEVHDTKLAKSSKTKFLVQLILYSELLANVQEAYPQRMHVVTGREGGAIESHETARYRDVVRLALARYSRFVSDEDALAEARPEPNDHCGFCGWRDYCAARWLKEDHLSRVANISQQQIVKLKRAGVTTVTALAALKEDEAVPGMSEPTLARLQQQARLQLEAERTGKPEVVRLPVEPHKGLGRMPAPHPEDLYFDMEGNPLEEGGPLEYLFGLYHASWGFKAFWALKREDEKSCFEEFMDFVMTHLQKHPGAHVYHYAAYEQTALKRLMTQYGTRESAVDHLLRQGLLVDLYQVVREGLRVSEPRYSIKNLEHFYAEKRQGEVTNAGASIIFFERWKETAEQRYLDDIERYNEDDVRSTLGLHRWLIGLRSQDEPWRVAPVAKEEAFEQSASHAEYQLQERINELMQRVAHLPDDNESRRVHQLLAYLLGFHRRADKPVWWAMFERQTFTEDELAEDLESLQGLTRIGNPVPVKKSNVWTYQYPSQETKLRAGASVVDLYHDLKAYTLHAHDESARTIQIKVGAQVEMPLIMNLGPGGPIDSSGIAKALQRMVDRFLRSGQLPSAIHDLLYRQCPSVSGVSYGDPLLKRMPPEVKEVSEVVAGLEESILFIQGPPGTGKTYTGSHLIVDEIRRGRRVAVLSNSHHAINNLLHAVESRAEQQMLRFKGVKKSTKDQPDTYFSGNQIENLYDSSTLDLRAPDLDLVAGTAWLFSRTAMEGVFDTLFVDEAGQVSLANLLACMPCARNVVLLGDQMQLAQPIQGSHPGQSGLSALDYLLDGHATIATDRGVFLSETWRMAPPITDFISRLVYESRLISQPDNARQVIHWPAGVMYKPQGIESHAICHEGNAQASAEEAAALAEVYRQLLSSTWTNRHGEQHPITSTDILVVSPYNLQVQKLKQVLPPDARVGTVDKFQGQEAAAVLISMATSSQAYLPRDIEFLFSTNRLNVAVTRGRAYVGFFHSPDLLLVKARTVEAMALVNTVVALAGFELST